MKLVSFGDLAAGFGVPFCRLHLMRLVKAGKFPTPIQLSPHRIAWREDDIVTWLESRDVARSVASKS